MNEDKSDFYGAGVDTEVIQRVENATGFKHSKLPFRYLGVPVCAKKISLTECESIVEKMCMRIKI